jgi:hypothetical protein
VQSAEASGTNVTNLADIMTQSEAKLSQAEQAYNNGDFDAATAYARESQSLLQGLVSQADSLRQTAEVQKSSNFRIVEIGIGASVAVVACGIGVWVLLDRRSKVRVK